MNNRILTFLTLLLFAGSAFAGRIESPAGGGTGGGGATPGGSDGQVQFNDGGSFGGSAFWTFDKTSGKFFLHQPELDRGEDEDNYLTIGSTFYTTTFGVFHSREQYIHFNSSGTGGTTNGSLWLLASDGTLEEAAVVSCDEMGNCTRTLADGAVYIYLQPSNTAGTGSLALGIGSAAGLEFSAGRFILTDADGGISWSNDYTTDDYMHFSDDNPIIFETGILLDTNWNPTDSNRHWLRMGRISSGVEYTHSALRFGNLTSDGIGLQFIVARGQIGVTGDPTSIRFEIEDNCSEPGCATKFTDFIGLKNIDKSTLFTIAPSTSGLVAFCSDCTTDSICVSSGTGTGAWVRAHERGTACD